LTIIKRRNLNAPTPNTVFRIGVETRLKGYKYFEIERVFFNKLGVLIDGDFKFGVLDVCEWFLALD
jgi:hypothetical protein